MHITSIDQVKVLQQKANEARNLKLTEAKTKHPGKNLDNLLLAVPEPSKQIHNEPCKECQEPQFIVTDTKTLQPTVVCRECVNALKLVSVNLPTDINICCWEQTDFDDFGLLRGMNRSTMPILDSEEILEDGTVRKFLGLNSLIALGKVDIDDLTGRVLIK